MAGSPVLSGSPWAVGPLSPDSCNANPRGLSGAGGGAVLSTSGNSFPNAAATRRLQQQKRILFGFWGLEVQNRSDDRALLPLRPAEGNPPSPALSAGSWYSLAFLGWQVTSSVCASVSQGILPSRLCLFASCKDASHIGLKAHPSPVGHLLYYLHRQ